MVIRQGEVYRVSFPGRGSEPWGHRPALVLQHDRFNHSRLNTVVVAAIASTLRYATFSTLLMRFLVYDSTVLN